MSTENGFRFGTRESSYPKGGDWVFVKGTHPKYDEIRKDQHRLDMIDDKLRILESKAQLALDMIRYLRALMLGGHVRRDKLATTQARIAAGDDPEAGVDAVRTWINVQ